MTGGKPASGPYDFEIMLLAAGFATIPLERVSDLDPVAVAEVQAYIAARADIGKPKR